MIHFDPSVWGPHYWFFLNTIAITYPHHPNSVTKKIYYDFIQHFHLFIPVKDHSEFFNQLLSNYPITPYLDNRESFIRWIHFIHNKINERLHKPTITYHQFYVLYYNQYKQESIQNAENRKLYKKIMFAVLLIFLYATIYYLYNR